MTPFELDLLLLLLTVLLAPIWLGWIFEITGWAVERRERLAQAHRISMEWDHYFELGGGRA